MSMFIEPTRVDKAGKPSALNKAFTFVTCLPWGSSTVILEFALKEVKAKQL